MPIKIFALEGLSMSGKTALCKKLEKKGIKVFYEIKGRNKKKNFLSNQINYLKENIKIIKKAKRFNNIVLLDRSILSTLSYTYSISKIKNKDYYKIFTKKYKTELKKYIPDRYIYIKISPKVSLYRRKNKNKSNKFIWSNREIIKHIYEYYNLYAYKNRSVYTINGNLSQNIIFKKIIGLIKNETANLSK